MTNSNLLTVCQTCKNKILISDYCNVGCCPICQTNIPQLAIFMDFAKEGSSVAEKSIINPIDKAPQKTSIHKDIAPGTIIKTKKKEQFIILNIKQYEPYNFFNCLLIDKQKRKQSNWTATHTEVKGYPVFLLHTFTIDESEIAAIIDQISQATTQQLNRLVKESHKNYEETKGLVSNETKKYLKKKSQYSTTKLATKAWRGISATKGHIKIYRG